MPFRVHAIFVIPFMSFLSNTNFWHQTQYCTDREFTSIDRI